MAVVGNPRQLPRDTFEIAMDGATFTSTWEVQSNDPTDDQYDIYAGFLSAMSFLIGQDYHGTQMAHVRGDRKTDCLWEVQVTFKNLTEEEQEKLDTPPLSRATVWKYKSREIEFPLMYDINNNGILNSAGQPSNPPLTWRTGANGGSGGIITATKNFASFPAVDAFLWCTNATPLAGYGPNTVLMTSAEGEQESWSDGQNSYTYYNMTFEFEIDVVNTHTRIVQNDGFQCFKDITDQNGNTNKTLVTCTDQFNHQCSEPALLDKNGYQLNPGSQPTFSQFTVYNSADFAGGLGL